jgi:hypothetical protein
MYMAVVHRPMPAAVSSRCCRRRFQQLAYTCGTKTLHGAQADARGATHVLDRGVQAVARGATRCFLNVLGRSAKTDACGHTGGTRFKQDQRRGYLTKACISFEKVLISTKKNA